MFKIRYCKLNDVQEESGFHLGSSERKKALRLRGTRFLSQTSRGFFPWRLSNAGPRPRGPASDGLHRFPAEPRRDLIRLPPDCRLRHGDPKRALGAIAVAWCPAASLNASPPPCTAIRGEQGGACRPQSCLDPDDWLLFGCAAWLVLCIIKPTGCQDTNGKPGDINFLPPSY